MEALIHHFQALYRGLSRARGETYTPLSRRRKGEFGVYLVADGTNKPYRCKIRAPGFAHLQAMDYLCKGHMLADTRRCAGSMDIVFRGDRPLSASAWRTMPKSRKALHFTPDYHASRRERAMAKYPEGRQQSAVLALLDLAQRQQRLGDARRCCYDRRNAGYGARFGCGKSSSFLHHVPHEPAGK